MRRYQTLLAGMMGSGERGDFNAKSQFVNNLFSQYYLEVSVFEVEALWASNRLSESYDEYYSLYPVSSC